MWAQSQERKKLQQKVSEHPQRKKKDERGNNKAIVRSQGVLVEAGAALVHCG
jgi:hypothetical protein